MAGATSPQRSDEIVHGAKVECASPPPPPPPPRRITFVLYITSASATVHRHRPEGSHSSHDGGSHSVLRTRIQ